MDWTGHAERLAADVTGRASPWREPIRTTPRHVFVPNWWRHGRNSWTLRQGGKDKDRWLSTTYSNVTLVTSVGGRHADHASPGDHPDGAPTSSSTHPSLVVVMLDYARIAEGMDVLDLATGSGYSAALLSRRLGPERVTSVDVDPYVTKAATARLAGIGLHPQVLNVDAREALPGTYDRIVSMVAVQPIPPSWLAALRPGGRLVTTITNTSMILTAEKTDDGGAVGVIQRDSAMFMRVRGPGDYPPGLESLLERIRDARGESVGTGRYPVIDMQAAWGLRSMMEVAAPGVEHYYRKDHAGRRTAWMLHPDGSWARASAHGDLPPTVHQGGPRRLWDELDEIRGEWPSDYAYPLYGADVRIDPDGTIHLYHGTWSATVG